MDASCGPSNALSQLSKHTQRDQSLQNEFVGRQGPVQPGNFRTHGHVDAGLNREFQNFNSDGMSSFDPLFAAQRHNAGPPMAMRQNPNWVQDFGGLSLGEQRGQTVPQGKADWHRQFMQQQQQQHQQQGQSQSQYLQMGQSGQFQGNQFQNLLQNSQFQNPAMFQGYRAGTGQYGQQNTQKLQHDGIELLQPGEMDFERHFDQVERELLEAEKMQQNEEQIDLGDESEKEQFAEAARQIKNLMTSDKHVASDETSSKFQELSFLKLMTLISDRQVELSREGDKLVERESGEDIRAHLSDPLRHEKETQPDYHHPVHGAGDHVTNESGITRESENVTSHLPDPLAHIKDGALPSNLTPLQAARIISGGQVMASDWTEDESWNTPHMRPTGDGIMLQEWQDVYEDYRNEDDFHWGVGEENASVGISRWDWISEIWPWWRVGRELEPLTEGRWRVEKEGYSRESWCLLIFDICGNTINGGLRRVKTLVIP